MASSNNRKLSQLPIAETLSSSTNFLVVNGIGTQPVNERITLERLYNQIPVDLEVGEELSGKDVTFNATDDVQHNFKFDSTRGKVTVGGELETLTNVKINGDLEVIGSSTLVNPSLVNLAISGNFTANGHSKIANSFNVTGETKLDTNLKVHGNIYLYDSLFAAGASQFNEDVIFDKKITSDSLVANTALINANTTISGNLFLDGYAEIDGKCTANSFETSGVIRSTAANIIGEAFVGKDITITNNAVITNKLTANMIDVGDTLNISKIIATGDISSDNFTASDTVTSDDLKINSKGEINELDVSTTLKAPTVISNSITSNTLTVSVSATIDKINSSNVISTKGEITDFVSTETEVERLTVTDTLTSNTTSVSDLRLTDKIRIDKKVSLPVSPATGEMVYYEIGGTHYLGVWTGSSWKATALSVSL